MERISFNQAGEEAMRKGLKSGKQVISLLLIVVVFVAGILTTSCRELNEETERHEASEPAAAQGPDSDQKKDLNASQNKGQNSNSIAAKVKTDQRGRILFDLSIDGFISRYNGHCSADKGGSLLPDAGSWSIYTSEQAVHSDHPVLSYTFSNEDAPDFYPTMQVNLSNDTGCVQELAIYYDDHDYREGTYREFENMCIYSIRSLYPKADVKQVSEFVKTVNNSNVPAGQEYEHGIIPSVLYHKDGIGIYPYRRAWASMYFCIIPVTKDRLQSFERQGTKLVEAF